MENKNFFESDRSFEISAVKKVEEDDEEEEEEKEEEEENAGESREEKKSEEQILAPEKSGPKRPKSLVTRQKVMAGP